VQAYLRGDTDFELVRAREQRATSGARLCLSVLINFLFSHAQWILLLLLVVAAAIGLFRIADRALSPLASIHLDASASPTARSSR